MTEIPRPSAAPAASTKVMGRFRCEQRIAADPWLETWKARVQGLGGFDQLFGLLCLAPGALARRPNAAENLLRAARSLGGLKDPRLCVVHDSGLAPGSAFVARELVHGVSLRDLEQYLHVGSGGVGSAPPPLPSGFSAVLAYVAGEIAAALAAAHVAEQPVFHGALGPTSVMLTVQGGIKLIDLGLRASVLTPQEIAGSPAHGPYAAPELARGQMGPPADLYALGRVIAGLGGGGSPGRGVDVVRALPGMLQSTVRQLLQEDPGQRPTAAQAGEQLRVAGREARPVDARAELGALVRLVLQVQANRPTEDDSQNPPNAYDGPAAPAPTELFADEPTAILAVSADGSPTPLASLLRDLRGHTDEDDDSTDKTAVPFELRGGHQRSSGGHSPTPLVGVPVVEWSSGQPPGGGATPAQDAFEFDQPTVMTSAVNLPIPAAQPRVPRATTADARATAPDPVPHPVPATASGPAPRIIQVLPSITPRSTPRQVPVSAPASLPPPEGSGAGLLPTAPAPVTTPAVAAAPAPVAPANINTMATVAAPAITDQDLLAAPVLARAAEPGSGTPVEELKDLTTEEISAGFAAPLERQASEANPQATPERLTFREFSGGMPLRQGAVTPPSWEPSGNLEESALPGERPGSLGGIEIPTRRRPRHAVTVAVGAVALVAVGAGALLLARSAPPRAQRPVVNVSGAPSPAETATGHGSSIVPLPSPGSRAEARNSAPAAAAESTPGGAAAAAAHAAGGALPGPGAAEMPGASGSDRPAAAAAAGSGSGSASPGTGSGASGSRGREHRSAGSRGSTAPAASNPAAAPAAAAPVAPPAVPESAESDTTEIKPPSTAPSTREIEVNSTPPGATVFVGGQPRGVTPLRLYVPSDATELKLVRPGYDPKTVTIDPGSSKAVEAILAPEGGATTAPAAPDSAKR